MSSAIQNPFSKSSDQSVNKNEGVVTVKSPNDFTETYNNLKETTSENRNLTILAELDHQTNAEGQGLELRPTKVLIFGNPNLGTPLMEESPSTGLDLPQKILVWQSSDGSVNLSFNDPEFLKQRHIISRRDAEIQQISAALENLANSAAGRKN